jgi:hypothetical protein
MTHNTVTDNTVTDDAMTDNTVTDDTETGSDDPTPTRQCGRCRGHFPIPADTHPMELRDWWTCAPCTHALLPGRHSVTTTHPTT